MAELKPCPFCGGKAVIHCCAELENETMAAVFSGKVGIHCQDCGIATMPHESENKAVDAWNRRTNEPEQKTGKWELRRGTIISIWYECDLCGNVTSPYPTNYCPNCGAKMEVNDG